LGDYTGAVRFSQFEMTCKVIKILLFRVPLQGLIMAVFKIKNLLEKK